jgi:Fe-S cluster biogenesis protein NfuA
MLLKEKVQKELDEVRPMLQMDGGDVELVEIDEATGTVKVRLQGHCAHCPMSEITLKNGIEARLVEKISEVKKVVQVDSKFAELNEE